KAVGTVQLNIENFTKILTTEIPDNSVGAAFLDNAGLDWATLLTAGDLNEASIVERGFTDDEIKALHGFATDTLLESMTGMITQIGRQRAKLGAEQNGITSLIRSNNTAAMNVAASKAQITDTDFAYETAELTRNQIIQQASSTVLSQANQLPNIALSLLR
ncbi:flagellin, partial [Oceanospirillum sp. HFRX-1_2]